MKNQILIMALLKKVVLIECGHKSMMLKMSTIICPRIKHLALT